jgi:hypothetical protein
MKPSTLLSATLLSAGLVLSLASARAEDPSSPPVPPPVPASPDTSPADGAPAPAPAHRRHMRQAFILADLTEKLGLTADQQKTIGGFIASADVQGKALRQDDSIPRDEKRQKMKAIMETTRGQIRGALTPAQQQTFDAMPRGEHGGQTSPTPTPAT